MKSNIFLLVLIIFPFFGFSQDTGSKPKVGLVLSGGAAHGFAHIGVIQYLEEIGIEIDHITGTSMGSVIGGLYAMGYTGEQIEHIARRQDWDLLMSNHSPLWEVAPIEKEFHEKIPLSIFWNNDAFRFPSGIIQGQKLDLIISKIYSPAYFIDHFDDLHIPFRCVAVDIEDGSIDVLESGFLGEAIRASMAIPSVFPPKRLDSILYVDGGLRRNFPVQENIDMGSDILIGVYVGGVRSKKDELNSVFDIFKQAAWMSSILDSEDQRKMLDVYIEPAVKDMGSFAFDKYKEFIALGYRAARDQHDLLVKIKDRLSAHPKSQRGKKLNNLGYLKFSDITTTESDPTLRKMILNKLKFKKNQKVSFNQLESSLALIFGTKNFSKTNYDFNIENDGIELLVDTEEVLPYNLGVSLNRFKNTNAALIFTGEARNVFGKPSSLRADLRVSETPGAQFHYYHRLPLKPSYLVKISGNVEQYDLPFYQGTDIDRLYKYDARRLRFGINKEWKNKFLFDLHYQYRYDRLSPRVLNTRDINRYLTEKHGLQASIEYNTLDRRVFPHEGQKSSIIIGYISSNTFSKSLQDPNRNFINFEEDNTYMYAELDHQNFIHTGRVCGEIYLRGRYSNGGSFLDHYRVGGPIQERRQQFGFVGVDDSELVIGNHLAAKVSLRIHFKKEIYLTPTIQYLYGEDLLSYAFDTERDISVTGYGIIVGINTPIGPVTMDIGYSDLKDRLVTNLGFGFRHIL